MRDFRTIREFELKWKETERAKDEAKSQMGKAIGKQQSTGGGGFNLEELLDELAAES